MDVTLICKVCNESQFTVREGFFYCDECGTKQDQVREVDVENDDEFNESKQAKKQKIKKIKEEKPELTSWECYNYILRGLVDQLLSLGAKEELKVMSLQVWAAYLRHAEVAFFNKKQTELPKLGLRFLDRDARTLYNHQRKKQIKRKRQRSNGTSVVSGESSYREWRKSKRKLDESAYSLHSSMLSTDVSMSQSSMNTSSTGTTSRPIQLKFSSKARRYLKKVMPKKHLEKHEKDAEGLLECHKIRPRTRQLKRMERVANVLSIRHVYCVLAIALNLIEDDLQMSDLVRLISEGHIGTKNAEQFFPEDIATSCKQMLHDINFFQYDEKCTVKLLRDEVSLLAKCINIREFKKPDIFKLAQRYITELNLPQDIGTFIERLINLLPPQMRTRVPHCYPLYETRAMAYVVFVLKLLFGLDGHKEKLISQSAFKINKTIKKHSKSERRQSPLFVWSEWQRYVEMRKVIVSHHNSSFCRQFQQCQSTEKLLQEIDEEQRLQNEQDYLANKDSNAINKNVSNMKSFLEKLLERLPIKSVKKEVITFPPSPTPAHSYFKRILFYCSSTESETNFQIPQYMRVDHSQRTLQPYLEPKKLKDFLHTCGKKVKILRAPCTSQRCYVGVFRLPSQEPRTKSPATEADFDISEEKWLKDITYEPYAEDLEFKTELDSYNKTHMKQLLAKHKKYSNEESLNAVVKEQDAKNRKNDKSVSKKALHRTGKDNTDVRSLHSFSVFSEDNMDPISNMDIKTPRRRLDSVNLFAGLSDEENDVRETVDNEDTSFESDGVPDKSTETFVTDTDTIVFTLSNMDLWLLMGSVNGFTTIQKKILENKFPHSFFWLLQTCAQTIGIEWSVLYEHLLTIEFMYAYGIENLDNFHDCLHFKYINPIKDFNMLMNSYRTIW